MQCHCITSASHRNYGKLKGK